MNTPNTPRLGSESSSPGGSIAGLSTTQGNKDNIGLQGPQNTQLQSSGIPTPLTIPTNNNQNIGTSTPSVSGTPPIYATTGFRFPPPTGLANWAENSKYDGNSSEKSPDTTKLNRKESYKAQRKNYRREKKRVASELLNSLQDPAVIVLADWLKVRGTLKSWTKLWCVLKPGLLLLYKSPKTKSSHWVGTVLITSCQVIERPSKKDGFCFKLFHPMEQSIWAPRGPDKETIGAVVQPLPTAYLIFRAPSQAAGKCWMDALELSLRCSALLLRSNSNSGKNPELSDSNVIATDVEASLWSEADYEKHFNDQEKCDNPLGKPQFLANFIPPTPPLDRRLIVLTPELIKNGSDNSSVAESRSTTPIFQNIYLAMSNWERTMSNSPEIQKMKKIKCAKLLKSKSKEDDLNDENCDSEDKEDSIRKFFKKSFSFGSFGRNNRRASTNESSSSDDDDDDDNDNDCNDVDKEKKTTNLDADSQNEGAAIILSGPDSESDSDVVDGLDDPEILEDPPETPYILLPEEEFGGAGEQVEELPEEHKSLIWFLVKQVRPGMDLSKVVLPTFILEPRSFLDKLSDSYYHADILSKAVLEDDPFTRMKTVVQWYLSGFYKKPKGLKKPYNPILGETFRCYWEHPNGARTFYIAEQVSHHPPISVFYVTNRQDGFSISCSILAKSKFYGNSTSAILEGIATLTLLPRGESYTLTVPYAHCKGILMGTLSMELGGKVSVECENTGYKTEIEFKLKPFLGGSEYTNILSGKIKLGKETMASINGHWDGEIKIKDSKSGDETILFSPTRDIRQQRLKRFVVPIDSQGPTESEKLWQHVTAAILRDDQVSATEEKTVLEEAQRNSAKERKATFCEWISSNFHQDLITGDWIYKYADLRPWDPRNDVKQYEYDYRIITKTRHQAPMVRTASIISGEQLHGLRADSRSSLSALKAAKRAAKAKGLSKLSKDIISDSSQSNDDIRKSLEKSTLSTKTAGKLLENVEKINKTLEIHAKQLQNIQIALERLKYTPQYSSGTKYSFGITYTMLIKSMGFIFLGIFVSFIVKLIYKFGGIAPKVYRN